MNENKNTEKKKLSIDNILSTCLVGLVVIGLVLGFVLAVAGIFKEMGHLGGHVKDYVTVLEAEESIAAGVVVDKKIVNGHTESGAGAAVVPGVGTGVVVSGDEEYVPTEYRIYIKAECGIDGKMYEFDKYFVVPVEVYQEYNIGDYFDSRDF